MQQQSTSLATLRLLLQHDLYFFESRMLVDLLGWEKSKVSHLLGRLMEQGWIERIERGKYLVLGVSPEKTLSNSLFIGSFLTTPAYISFWSALHYYGLTEQVPQRVFVATTRQKRSVRFHHQTYQFVRLKPSRFFGYHREQLGDLPIVIANEAKTLLDSLTLPKYAGGMGEVIKALRTALQDREVDQKELIEYAIRMNSTSIIARVGFLLEWLGYSSDGLPLVRNPVSLDPQRKRGGRYIPKWKLYINLPLEEVFVDGVG